MGEKNDYNLIYLIEGLLHMKCFVWLILINFVHIDFSMLKIVQLLLLLLCFLSGSRWVPSYNIFFLISSLAILCRILCFAWLYLQWNQHPKVTKINPPTPTSHDLLILLVNKKCPKPATTDPNEPYNIESRAQGIFWTSKNPRSLKA